MRGTYDSLSPLFLTSLLGSQVGEEEEEEGDGGGSVKQMFVG